MGRMARIMRTGLPRLAKKANGVLLVFTVFLGFIFSAVFHATVVQAQLSSQSAETVQPDSVDEAVDNSAVDSGWSEPGDLSADYNDAGDVLLAEENWDEEIDDEGELPAEDATDSNFLDFDAFDSQSSVAPQQKVIEDPYTVHLIGVGVCLLYFSGLISAVYTGSRMRIQRDLAPELIIVLYVFWPVFFIVAGVLTFLRKSVQT